MIETYTDLARENVRNALHLAEHRLPAQKPIESFVHHNTLHSFEQLNFEDAVKQARSLYGAEPFVSESFFRDAFQTGRILERDIDHVLQARIDDSAIPFLSLELREVVKRLMLHPWNNADPESLNWQLSELKLFENYWPALTRDFVEKLLAEGPAQIILPRLFEACLAFEKKNTPELPTDTVRLRDRIHDQLQVDIDDLVVPLLIRWTGAYLDNGFAYWPMSDREQGFLKAVVLNFVDSSIGRPWLNTFCQLAREFSESEKPIEELILKVLQLTGVNESEIETYVLQTLLALPGWAGMFVQLSVRPDLAPGQCPPTHLAEFLAVKLLIEYSAALHVLQTRGNMSDNQPLLDQLKTDKTPDSEEFAAKSRAWSLFQACQVFGIGPARFANLSHEDKVAFAQLLKTYGDLPRRVFWQIAFERRYRIRVLDGLIAHQEFLQDKRESKKPTAQIVCCIDDREESLRRHLEEVSSDYQTLGVAGFYGIPMYFRPLHHPKITPLCPPSVIPKHLVEEQAVDTESAEWKSSEAKRRLMAKLVEAASVGSRTLLRGGFTALWGWGSAFPMVSRLLTPALHKKWFGNKQQHPTKLKLLREDSALSAEGLIKGFSYEEMTDIVETTLNDMGLREFADLVIVLGHGSESVNNPHEAAYNCGACGGGRGGPNARAFAEMANSEEIRSRLKDRGLVIPESTWFIGGYHNTGDDSIDYFDLDLVPDALGKSLERVIRDLDEARRRDAHERCRRFMSAPLSLSQDEALKHVETRVCDLGQPRPEYGHSSNALCLVGRRSWSRGLFLDRRVFLTSYDPSIDPERKVLERLLTSVAPVGAGINLEYYFSYVDPVKYGCDSKLPHNVSGLLGVMDGHSSDLRTGLYWQMVEIHEPVRLLNVIEARPEELQEIMEKNEGVKKLIANRWILVAAFDPSSKKAWYYDDGGFVEHVPESASNPVVESSKEWYGGRRDHLMLASITSGFEEDS